MIYGVLAYLLWGLFPAFFPLLLPAGPLEILAHRILWTAVLMSVVLAAIKGWGQLRNASRGTWALLITAGLLISANWGIYVLAVNSDHVADAALGYFINPLLSILLAVVFLGERLNRMQLLAVGIAAIGVIQLTFLSGQAPVMALGMALSFGFYGLVKKRVKVSAAASLTAETLAVAPLALIYLIWLESTGQGTFFTEGPTHMALLVVSGAVTTIPLLLFGMAAKRLPLATIGMIQYLTPTLQMLWALFVTQEQLSPARWAGFIIIWVAVTIYLVDIARRRNRSTDHGQPLPANTQEPV
ncbi:EamA family transporter RarD [Corynebacterium alimapuense]|uniref:EamA family transporter RarD n=1 Tax=Corynebacterium alimapuense TaxID=1576874 RepID=A0A3M8K8C2_9CORY|nr:EamA family transporter RarD [Corynebacterium alimapuense]RNE49471.1 EamA family transporter RarD [Corynebacterium alimapuense]